MRIDQAGDHHLAGGFHLLQAPRVAPDHAVAHHQVADLVDAGLGVEHPDPAQHQVGGRSRPLKESRPHQTATAPSSAAVSAALCGAARRS